MIIAFVKSTLTNAEPIQRETQTLGKQIKISTSLAIELYWMMWLRACQICSQAWACQLSHRQQSLPTAPAHGHHQQFHQAFTGQDNRKPLSLQVSDSQRKKENCVGGLDSNLQPESHSSCRRNKGHEKGRSITLMRRLGT